MATDAQMAKHLRRAKEDIQENAFCGIPVPKKQIPKKFIKKYRLENLWKYDLPNAWRLLYTVKSPSRVEVVSVILDWMNHRDYDRLFRY